MAGDVESHGDYLVEDSGDEAADAPRSPRNSLLFRNLMIKGGGDGSDDNSDNDITTEQDVCSIPKDLFLEGMGDISDEYGNFTSLLLNYEEIDALNGRYLASEDRDLAWAGLLSAAKGLGGTFLKTLGKNSGKISDALGIAAAVVPFFVDADAAFKQEVFERFDAIDAKLDEMEDTIKDGFQELKDLINQLSVNEIIQGIEVDLNALDSAYRDYINPLVVDPAQVRFYKEAFRDACVEPKAKPYAIFQLLYSYTCKECDAMNSGPAVGKLEFFDTFINKARDVDFRTQPCVLYYRRNFVSVIMAYMAKAMYLEAVCLKAPTSDDSCPVEDPNTARNLQEMEAGLVEVAGNFQAEEARLIKCPRKFVRIKGFHVIGDLDGGGLTDRNAELRVELGNHTGGFPDVWPTRECPCGGNVVSGNYCRIHDNQYNNRFYKLPHDCPFMVFDGPDPKPRAKILEKDTTRTSTSTATSPDDWFDDTCDSMELEIGAGGDIRATFTLEIVAEQGWIFRRDLLSPANLENHLQ